MRAVLARPGSAAEQSRRAAEAVRVVAIGKTKLVSLLRQLYDAGHRCFGENYVQEFVTKAPQLPEDIRWHFVGHLQSNKVKSLVGLLFFAITPHLTPRIISGHSSSAAATQLAPMTPCMEQVKVFCFRHSFVIWKKTSWNSGRCRGDAGPRRGGTAS
ncbi:pyridoxal phosphate homeostasis protein-like isoform X2 [Triticum dicoccoides]|uniref:pyridoxal phosphate homeostasis protein-like isoform X2 n=1 Tax=Triticum dicoccoides TaxID=85692 RepID=UPI00188FB8D9|nr:pyridoxal phosphate homeostasis protein-like isoform X2 [Triticum dicoccoides]